MVGSDFVAGHTCPDCKKFKLDLRYTCTAQTPLNECMCGPTDGSPIRLDGGFDTINNLSEYMALKQEPLPSKKKRLSNRRKRKRKKK